MVEFQENDMRLYF